MIARQVNEAAFENPGIDDRIPEQTRSVALLRRVALNR
jgi:hypothetical protein